MLNPLGSHGASQLLRRSSPLSAPPRSGGDQVTLGQSSEALPKRPVFAAADPARETSSVKTNHAGMWAALGLVGLGMVAPAMAQAEPPVQHVKVQQQKKVDHQPMLQESQAHQAGRQVKEKAQQVAEPFKQGGLAVKDESVKFGKSVAHDSVKFGHGVRDFFKGLGGH